MTLVAGPPDAPAIVFVHGTRLTGAMWTPQLAAPDATSSGRSRWTCPAHGTPRRPSRSRSMAPRTPSPTTIADEAAGGRAIVVGLSLGGYVAMALAAREPERVRGPRAVGRDRRADRRPDAAVPRRSPRSMDRHRRGPARSRSTRGSSGAATRPPIAEPIVAGGFWSRGGAAALRAVAGERFLPRLAAYPGPTLIINGELRPAVPALRARSFARGRPATSRRVRLAGRQAPRQPRPAGGLHARPSAGSRGRCRRRRAAARPRPAGGARPGRRTAPPAILARPADTRHPEVRCASERPSSPPPVGAPASCPATKAQPKEMLPLVDKPIIQYAVEEAVAAGIEQVIIVTSSQKRAIEDHFDLSYELEHLLEEKGDIEMLRQVRHDQRPRPGRVRPPEGAARPRSRGPDGQGPRSATSRSR